MEIDPRAWVPFEGTVDGEVFSGRRFNWEPGFYVRDVGGLLSGGRVSSDSVQAMRGAGTLFTAGKRDREREIVISGFAFARHQQELAELADRFAGILADETTFGVLAWVELGLPRRHTTVARRGTPEIARRGRNRIAPFSLTLRAPDQRIYGEPLETSGWGRHVTVTNRGNYPAPIRLRVRGSSSSGYTITGPRSRIVQVTRALTSGVSQEYDSDTGALAVGGALVTTGVGRRDQLEIPPGTHTVSASVSGAELLVSGFHTYAP